MVRAVAMVTAAALIVSSCIGGTESTESHSPAPLPDTTIGSVLDPADDPAADPADEPADEPDPPVPTGTYADEAHWLCIPGRDDACAAPLDTTRIEPGGHQTIEVLEPDTDPPIDCFYVYPTVSDDPTPNSGLDPTDAERRAVRAQFAPFTTVCRPFAPMYRQITRAALTGTAQGVPDRGLAYRDVVEAWDHYLTHHNDGRGVVLVGHSQGAGMLRELLAREIEPEPDQRDVLVSAILLGTTVRVPVDGTTGADLAHLGPCRSPAEVGCVISYSTYAADDPPGDIGFFGAVRDTDDEQPMCTNPAALDGGAAPLDSLLIANPLRDGEVDTPWVRYTGMAEAECVVAGNFHYLEVRFASPPRDGWPPDLGGRLSTRWGLHLIDVNVALGDLVELVGQQGAAYTTAR